MIEVTTVSGKIHKFQGHNWEVRPEGILVIKTGKEDYTSVFAAGQWESLKELGK